MRNRKRRILRPETLEKRQLLAADVALTDGVLTVDGTENNDSVFIYGTRNNTYVFSGSQVEVNTSFEAGQNFVDQNGVQQTFGRDDVVNFRIDPSEGQEFGLDVFGRRGTRGVPPAYNTGAFAVGIGENITIIPSDGNGNVVPADNISFAVREIVEATPDVRGTVKVIGTRGIRFIEATDNGADPAQSGDWDRIDTGKLGIGKTLRVEIITRNGITNIDDLSATGTVREVQRFQTRDIDAVFADFGDGDDVFVNHSNLPSFVLGGKGDDVLIGGRNRDVIIGGEGRDYVVGGRGRDIIIADRDDIVRRDREDLVIRLNNSLA